MDNRPIGVFDSGLGGLTTVKVLRSLLPGEDIIYFGDTGRVPYGGRSRETIMKYARQDIAFLLGFDIKAVVAACGTVSTNGLSEIASDYDMPVYGVAESAAKRAAALTKSGRVGIIGTVASIRSGAYDRLLRAIRPEIEVTAQACPLFVPLVENGRTDKNDKVLRILAEEYLTPVKETGVDALILGCTHYPLIREVIGDIMGPNVELIDPGAETARLLAETLREKGLLSDRTAGHYRYFVSDSVEGFTQTAAAFLQADLGGEVQRISVDEFKV